MHTRTNTAGGTAMEGWRRTVEPGCEYRPKLNFFFFLIYIFSPAMCKVSDRQVDKPKGIRAKSPLVASLIDHILFIFSPGTKTPSCFISLFSHHSMRIQRWNLRKQWHFFFFFFLWVWKFTAALRLGRHKRADCFYSTVPRSLQTGRAISKMWLINLERVVERVLHILRNVTARFKKKKILSTNPSSPFHCDFTQNKINKVAN